MRSRNGRTLCWRCGRLAERLPLLLSQQTVSLLLLFLRQFNARAAAPAIRNHEPDTHRERRVAIGTAAHQRVTVQPDAFGSRAGVGAGWLRNRMDRMNPGRQMRRERTFGRHVDDQQRFARSTWGRCWYPRSGLCDHACLALPAKTLGDPELSGPFVHHRRLPPESTGNLTSALSRLRPWVVSGRAASRRWHSEPAAHALPLTYRDPNS